MVMVEPLLYRTFALDTQNGGLPLANVLQIIRAKPPAFLPGTFGTYSSAGPVRCLLTICVPFAPSALARSIFFSFDCVEDTRFNDSIFSNLTHLTVFYEWKSPHHWAKVSQIPNLTHLCLTEHRVREICPPILQTYGNLLVLLAYCACPVERALEEDPRFVVIARKYVYVFDWQRRISSGIDHWALVDKFIAKPNVGQIASSTYVLQESVGPN
ncbi:hypothetical protein B0H13DRAFT_2338586 [Mycena leptocephala]|nr:hypothetical protein B0H13DRAFT_2338586 [Mycena leptocephala]